jgi:heme-degrading monooxygenase HmoA
MFHYKQKDFLPPFYAVIFVSEKSVTLNGFEEMDKITLELASSIDGFIGYETVGNEKENIFISYWKNKECIDEWRKNSTHLIAKKMGKEMWYKRYVSQICLVESSHTMEK